MQDVIKWNFPYKKIILFSNEVHIWRARLSFTTQQLNTFFSFLTNDEKDRALKFSFKSDIHKFIISRAILRLIISRYLNLYPSEIVFFQNYYGKPFVVNQNLRFNVSHSNEYAVFAFTESKTVGIDIEFIREGFDEIEIAERFFSPKEIMELKSIPPFLRKKAFFNCWTRKEAFIKAKGTGLSTPLDSFDVAITPETLYKPICINQYDGDIGDLILYNLNIAKGYSSALVTQNKPDVMKFWDWNYTIEVIDRYNKTEKIFVNRHVHEFKEKSLG